MYQYFLEWGEYSNTINFTIINIISYIIIIIVHCTLVYWGIWRYSEMKARGEGNENRNIQFFCKHQIISCIEKWQSSL